MKNKIVLLFISVCYTTLTFAGKMEWVTYLDKADIIGNAKLSINIPNAYNLPNQVSFANLKARLSYTRENRTDVHDTSVSGWTYNINYSINETSISAPTSSSIIANQDLMLSFGQGLSYLYEQIKVDVVPDNLLGGTFELVINGDPISVNQVPDDIRLELILEVETYCEVVNDYNQQPTIEWQYIKNNEQLEIFWPYIECAEEYELEYVFVDSCTYIDDKDDFLTHLHQGFGNVVRINTSNQYYTLDMHYPAGTLFIKLRGVGVFTQNVGNDYTHIKYSYWSNYIEVPIATPFEPKKMWQVVSTFAEDGKYKKVNTFVDGSGRTRQVLTNLSSDSTVIIGETKYDDEGRAALSFMPVPKPGHSLEYRPLFNRPNGTTLGEYGKGDYRTIGQIATAANGNVGAAQYYSSDINSPTESIHKDYIPDSEGYPFSHTQYDGLGRPKLQGGVGETHQIGNNHETKLFYPSANSTELRRLFGSNVGKAKHYSKDVVMDANGQISVAYKDLADRTIATALAGDSPDNVIPLDYANSQQIAVNLNENNIIDEALGESYSQSTIMNLSPNTVYTFNYDFQGVINEVGLPYEVCPTCEYILEVSICAPGDCFNPNLDDIDLIITSSHQPEVLTYSSLRDTINATLLQDCNNDFPLYELGFTTTFLEVGEYTINKTLKVSETSWDNFLQSILESSALPDSSAMIQEYISRIDSSACEIVTSNDSLIQEIIDTIASIECQNLLETLKQGIRPGGEFYNMAYNNYDTTNYSFEMEDNIVMNHHPDYCQYIHCMELEDSRTYDVRAQLIKGWMEAGNPSSMLNQYNIDFTDPVATDPVFDDYFPNNNTPTIGCLYPLLMNNYLNNHAFTFTENGIQNTIIGLENFAHFLAVELSGSQNNQVPVSFDELKWQFYRGYYQSKKQELIRAFQADPTCNGIGVCESKIPCPPPIIKNLDLNDRFILTGDLQVLVDFSASIPVEENGVVTVQAGNSITLKPGFCVNSGSTFHGFIEPLSASFTDCDDDPRNAIFDIKNQQDLYNWTAAVTNNQGLGDCDGSCDTTVMAWMDVLGFFCDSLSSPKRQADSLLIAQKLKAYCVSKCSELNPFVFIKESEWGQNDNFFGESLTPQVDGDPNLLQVQNILSQHCSDTLYKLISLEEVCTIDTISFTNHIIDYTIDTCLNQLIEGMNALLFNDCGIPNGNYLPSYSPNRFGITPNCLDNPQSILLGPSTTYTDQLYFLYDNFGCAFLVLIDNNGNKIPLQDISELSLPTYSSVLPAVLSSTIPGSVGDLIFKNLSAKVTNKSCQIFEVYFYGSCDNVNFVSEEDYYEEVTSIDTTCLCQPPQYELDIEDYYDKCIEELVAEARYNAIQNWNDTIAEILTDLRENYKCLPSLESTPCHSLDFTATEDNIEIAGNPMAQVDENQFTFEFWLKGLEADQLGNTNILSNYTGGNGFSLFIRDPRGGGQYKTFTLQMANRHQAIWVQPNHFDGNCHHVAVVHDFPNLSFYLDGQLVGSRSTESVGSIDFVAPLNSGAPLRIGNGFKGELKDIRIWNVARSHAEIQVNMTKSLTGTETGLVAYYDMNEGDGQTLTDRTGNGYNGRLGHTDGVETSDPTWIQDCCEQIQHEEGFVENFQVDYITKEYHYTLYHYDQAGNLVMTIPPEAVFPATIDPDKDFTGSNKERYIGPEPDHNYNLASHYQFNTWNQPIEQKSPDGGITAFYYDDIGQLRISQNAHQRANATEYSYSKYDEQGRPIEVGQVDDLSSFTPANLNNPDFPEASIYTLSEIVETAYDQDESGDYVSDRNLRGRVAEVRRSDKEDLTHSILSYDYDPHGNVKRLLTKAAFLDPKEVTYEYDQISGNVNEVCFQAGRPDQYAHRFAYDADNRLTHVWTSRDYVIWQQDARYFYYAHGPLARVEIGEDIVQGLDYFYSLLGWLKGMNIPEPNGKNDPGKDAYNDPNNLNRWTGRDTTSFALGYYQGDYIPKNTTVNLGAASSGNTWSELSAYGKILGNALQPGLFNGNIAWMITDIPENGAGSQLQAMAYKYDQLHRIKAANSFQEYDTGKGWFPRNEPTVPKPYDANYSYDKNGNLKTLNRWGQNATQIDALQYNYDETNERKNSNQLITLDDPEGHQEENDLDEYHEYTYDEIGNLISDVEEKIDHIDWYVDGKVKEITFNADHEYKAIAFRYDAMGNRIQKILKKGDTQVDWTILHYSRDPQGNILAIYEQTFEEIVPIQPADLELEMACSKEVIIFPPAWKPKFDITITNKGPNNNFTAEVHTPINYLLGIESLSPANGTSPYISYSTQNLNQPTANAIWTISNLPVGQSITFSIQYEQGVSGIHTTQSAYIQISSVPDPDSTPGNNAGEDDEATCTPN